MYRPTRHRRVGPLHVLSALNVSLFCLQVVGPGGAMPAVAAATASTATSSAPSSTLPPNLGDAATSFDVDADWVRIRLGLDENGGQPQMGRKTKRKKGKKKGRKPQFQLQLPKMPEFELPKLKVDFKQIGDDIGKIFGRSRRREGTHIRRVADTFESVLRASSSDGHIDAVVLLEACREFLPVMKTFGPDAAAKDFSRNLKKADNLRKHFGRIGGGKKGRGKKQQNKKRSSKKQHKSLEELLSAEVEAGIHKPGGILKDPSGAVGFLWMRRSIAYQHALFEAITTGIEPKQAAYDAYRSTLMPFHGWAMRRLYTAFLGQCTPSTTREVIAQIAGYDVHDLPREVEQATVKDLRRLVSLWGPLLTKWKKIHEYLDLEDVRRH